MAMHTILSVLTSLVVAGLVAVQMNSNVMVRACAGDCQLGAPIVAPAGLPVLAGLFLLVPLVGFGYVRRQRGIE